METNATKSQLLEAINIVNEKHGYRIILSEFYSKNSKRNRFRIRSEKSGIAGSRLSHSGRKLPSASWHAHGYLFDELFKINPSAYVMAMGRKVTINEGNWVDWNAGSIVSPIYASNLSIF